MAPEQYDRTAIIEGKLQPMPKNSNAAWAKPGILHDGPRTMTMLHALHIEHSDGRRGVVLRFEKFDEKNDDGNFTGKTAIPLDEDAVNALCSYLAAQEVLKLRLQDTALHQAAGPRGDGAFGGLGSGEEARPAYTERFSAWHRDMDLRPRACDGPPVDSLLRRGPTRTN